MTGEIIYIKADQNVVINHKKIFLEDVVKIYGEDKKLVKDLSGSVFMTIKDGDQDIMVSILKVMETIHSLKHGIEIVNIGETDFIIEYRQPNTKQKWMEYVKTGVVTFTAFFGAAFSIMTFNLDSSVSDVFSSVYTFILGNDGQNSHILEVSYSLGLSLGILIFYNHFTKKHLRDDPTPIQIQMRMYEQDKNSAKIQDSSREGKTLDSN